MNNIIKKILIENTLPKTNSLFQDKKVVVKSAGKKGNGLFAAVDINKDDIILLGKVSIMNDKDWELIKDTEPVKLYGFRWINQYGIPLGKWKFDFKNIKERLIWKKTDFYKEHCQDGLRLSGFLFVNDIDDDTTANVEDIFNFPKKMIGIKAIRDIKAGEELIKEYNYDWKEEFKSWRQGIKEGLNLPKRATPEQWFSNLLKQMEQVTKLEYPDSIFFHINGEIYMEYYQKSKTLFYHYDTIYEVLESKYNLNKDQINELVKDMVEEHTNLKVNTIGAMPPFYW